MSFSHWPIYKKKLTPYSYYPCCLTLTNAPMSTLAGYCVNHHNVSMSKLRNPNQQDLVLVVGHCRVLPRHRDVVLQAGEAAEQVHGSLGL